MGLEQERLRKRLFENPDRELVNFGISVGEGRPTAEQLASEINRAMDEVEALEALPVEEQMRHDITRVYEDLSIAIKDCQYELSEELMRLAGPMSEDRKRISRIFGRLDMALLTLGNWIDHSERRAVKQRDVSHGAANDNQPSTVAPKKVEGDSM